MFNNHIYKQTTQIVFFLYYIKTVNIYRL